MENSVFQTFLQTEHDSTLSGPIGRVPIPLLSCPQVLYSFLHEKVLKNAQLHEVSNTILSSQEGERDMKAYNL